jgi:radical SAM protein (TIGR01212 family)
MPSETNHLPYFSIGQDLKTRFGGKIVKLSLDAGFTCPNRDGTKGFGGCSFCSPEGSGELSSDMAGQMALLSRKWPAATGYLAYFQSHTNTYAPVSQLRALYQEALSYPKVVGIAIATRPDCLDDEVLDLLEELNRQTFLWVELGLQTIHEDTANRMNRSYPLSMYDAAVANLSRRNIRIVTHLILGLPGESKQDMVDSVGYVTQLTPDQKRIYGLKLHLLNVVKGSALEKEYEGYIPFASPKEYIDLICDLLPLISPEITIHRLTGDVPRKLLVAPEWSYKKRTILNGIFHEMARREKIQGCDL